MIIIIEPPYTLTPHDASNIIMMMIGTIIRRLVHNNCQTRCAAGRQAIARRHDCAPSAHHGSIGATQRIKDASRQVALRWPCCSPSPHTSCTVRHECPVGVAQQWNHNYLGRQEHVKILIGKDRPDSWRTSVSRRPRFAPAEAGPSKNHHSVLNYSYSLKIHTSVLTVF